METPEILYKRLPSGEFKQVGYDWTGWPSNGMWLVKDAKQQLLVKLDDVPTTPPYLPSLKAKTDQCATHIMANLPENYSKRDVADLAAEYYANLITEEKYPEAFL